MMDVTYDVSVEKHYGYFAVFVIRSLCLVPVPVKHVFRRWLCLCSQQLQCAVAIYVAVAVAIAIVRVNICIVVLQQSRSR